MGATAQETLQLDLLLNAQSATANLQKFLDLIKSGKVSAQELAGVLQNLAASNGVSINNLLTAYDKFAPGIKNVSQEMLGLGKAAKDTTDSTESLGTVGQYTFGYVLGNLGVQAIRQLAAGFVDLVDRGVEYEKVLFQLTAASNAWKGTGGGFPVADLEKFAAAIRAISPDLSLKQSLEAAANLAFMTREMNIGKNQAIELGKVAASISILKPQSGDVISVEQRLDTAIASGRSQGLRSLGFAINDTLIRERALALGAQEVNGQLSQEDRQAATLSLVLEQSNGLISEAGKFQGTLAGQVAETSGNFNTLKDSIGTFLLAFSSGFISTIPGTLNNINNIVAVSVKLWIIWLANIVGVGVAIDEVFKGNINSVQQFNDVVLSASLQVRDSLLATFFPKAADSAGAAEGIHRVTDAVDGLAQAEKDAAQTDLESLFKALENFGQEYERKVNDYNQKVARESEDYQKDRQRSIEDYNTNVARVLADANDKKAKIEQDARDKTAELEARFQEKMLELKEKYLFDLDDALHARDAHQILHLQKQYKLQQAQEIRQHQLDLQFETGNKNKQLADLQDQTAQRLAQMAQEEATRLQRMDEDYKIRKARAQEDFNDEMNQLRINITQKLQEVARGLAAELHLNAAGANALYNLLAQYYGPNGLFDGLYNYSYESLMATQANMLNQIGAVAGTGGFQATSGVPGSLPSKNLGGGVLGVPKLKSVGKSGLGKSTAATTIPRASQAPSGGLSGRNGSTFTGSLGLSISLAEGLVAQIVDTAVGGTVDLITKVQNGR